MSQSIQPGARETGIVRGLYAAALGVAVAAALVARDPGDGARREAVAVAGPQAVAGRDPVARQKPSSALRVSAGKPAGAQWRRFAAIVDKASRAYGVEAALVHAVILAESSYDPDARSPAGASGLMQLMPETARHYGVEDLFDPSQNIHGGVRLLRDLLRQFDGNLELALAAYNAGTTAVIRAGHQVPPLAETRAYVPKVIDHYRRLRALEG